MNDSTSPRVERYTNGTCKGGVHGVGIYEWRRHKGGDSEIVMVDWRPFEPGEAPWDQGVADGDTA